MQHSARTPSARSRLALVLGVIGVLAGCAAPAPRAQAPTAPGVQAPTAPAAAPPVAAAPAAIEQQFAQWVAAFRVSARAAGIDEATLAAAFDGVQYLPEVVERDRAQPEFVRPVWSYLDAAVSARRVAQGQAMLDAVRAQADAAAASYGVPATILVAIWGIESNYGSHYGDIPTIDALATLGFDGRREAWARGELLAALRILQHGDIDRAHMIGSWAGAMGQTQLLPSSYLTYAVDADGDGRRDIWASMPDVLASTANLLARAGWRAGEPWGVEVALPPGFDPARADASTRQDSAQWAAEGLRTIDGQALPPLADAAVFLPAGARGPAFLVGANFRAIMRYNASTSYALAVGILAQRLAGGPGVVAAWPRDLTPLTRSQLQALQTALSAQGFDAGPADGMLGPKTRAALRRWQRSVGLAADGYPTLELLDRLQAP
jgi:membrane-bound lytic murein transglycosylase B